MPMTADDFLVEYARRHGLVLADFAAKVVLRECKCRLSGCHGWEIDWDAMASKERSHV